MVFPRTQNCSLSWRTMLAACAIQVCLLQNAHAWTPSPAAAVCTQSASTTQQSNGISFVTDPTCHSYTTGCAGQYCRKCQSFWTPHSKNYPLCTLYASAYTPEPTPAPSPSSLATGGSKPEALSASSSFDGSAWESESGSSSSIDGFSASSSTGSSESGSSGSSESGSSTSGSSDSGSSESGSSFSSDAAPTSSSTSSTGSSTPSPSPGPSPSSTGSLSATSSSASSIGGSPVSSSSSSTSSPSSADSSSSSSTSPSSSSSGDSSATSSSSSTSSGQATPEPSSTTPTPVAGDTCYLMPLPDQSASGIAIVSDPSCANGGTGCINVSFRYCKIWSTQSSNPYLDCAAVLSITASSTPTPSSEAPIPAPSSETPTPTPSPETEAPTSTPLPDTPTPVSGATCGMTVSFGDAALGIHLVADTSCATEGGVGCVNDICRYCRTQSNVQSNHMRPCSDFTGTSTPTVVTTAPAVSSGTGGATCTVQVSEGDAALGIRIIADASCEVEGGVGCFGDTACRYCKTSNTPQSAHLITCPSSGPSASASSSSSSTPAPSVASFDCMIAITIGDSEAGISAVTDPSCSPNGGLGCFSDTCRFCKTSDTVESEHLMACTGFQ